MIRRVTLLKGIEFKVIELFKNLRPATSFPLSFRYLITAVLIVISGAVIWAIGHEVSYTLYVIYLPAIVFCSFLFNSGSGILATLLATLFSYFVLLPLAEPLNLGAITGLVVLGVVGIVTALFLESLRVAVDELNRAESRLKQSDAQKSLLLKDIHHRIKNHLQGVVGSFQVKRLQTTDSEAQKVLDDVINQLFVLAGVFDRLNLHAEKSTKVSAKAYIGGLCSDLKNSVVRSNVKITTDLEDHEIQSGFAISLGIIISELVMNALKHAFPNNREGIISVKFAQCDGSYCLTVTDNGIGISKEHIELGSGWMLINSFVFQHQGKLEYSNPPGLSVSIIFPMTFEAGKIPYG